MLNLAKWMVDMMTSLRNGFVPVRTNNPQYPVEMFPFPTKKHFCSLYKKSTRPETLDRYWKILCRRVKGYTLAESGKPYGLTRERVRQIEAKFIRLFGEKMISEKSKSSSMPELP
jgi:hypothetical protein